MKKNVIIDIAELSQLRERVCNLEHETRGQKAYIAYMEARLNFMEADALEKERYSR